MNTSIMNDLPEGKADYQTPELVAYGTVEALTQAAVAPLEVQNGSAPTDVMN